MAFSDYYHDRRVTSDAERKKLDEAFGELADGVNAALKLFLRYMGDIHDVIEIGDKKPVHKLPVLMMLDFAEAIDAVVVLTRLGAARGCIPSMRQALEIRLLLQYVTQDKSTYERRSLACEYWCLRNDLHWGNKFDPNDEKGKALRKQFGKHAGVLDHENLDIVLDGLKAQMADAKFDIVRVEIKRMEQEAIARREAAKGSKLSGGERKACEVRAWHRLWDGPSNTPELAKEVGEQATYELCYRIWSDSVHGAAASRRIDESSVDAVQAYPLRHPKGLYSIASWAYLYCLDLSGHLVNFYVPQRRGDYDSYSLKNVIPKMKIIQKHSGLT